MANLDSTNKRRSATGIFHLYTIPWNPDGIESSEKREHATGIYGGISAGVAVVISAIRLVVAEISNALSVAVELNELNVAIAESNDLSISVEVL